MSAELSTRMSMDTIRPISSPRDTDGQIKAVSSEERNAVVDVVNDVSVSGNDVPAESRVIQEVDQSMLNKAIDDLTHHAQSINRDLEFIVDDELDRTVITVYESDTEKVIRQIPSEEVLQLARHLNNDDKSSVLVNIKA